MYPDLIGVFRILGREQTKLFVRTDISQQANMFGIFLRTERKRNSIDTEQKQVALENSSKTLCFSQLEPTMYIVSPKSSNSGHQNMSLSLPLRV